MKRLPSPSLASSGSRASWRFPKTKASVANMPASSTPSKASMYAQCTEQFPGEKLLTRSPHNARISAHVQESGNNTHASAKQKPAPQTHMPLGVMYCLTYLVWISGHENTYSWEGILNILQLGREMFLKQKYCKNTIFAWFICFCLFCFYLKHFK